MAQYDSASIEKRWQDMWKDEAVYRFDPESDKPVYSIDNPPRYTSGPLHLGTPPDTPSSTSLRASGG